MKTKKYTEEQVKKLHHNAYEKGVKAGKELCRDSVIFHAAFYGFILAIAIITYVLPLPVWMPIAFTAVLVYFIVLDLTTQKTREKIMGWAAGFVIMTCATGAIIGFGYLTYPFRELIEINLLWLMVFFVWGMISILGIIMAMVAVYVVMIKLPMSINKELFG